MMVLILHNRTHHPCNILTLNSPRTEPEAAVGPWMGITDKPEWLGLLLGNSRGLNMAPQNREAEEQLCLRPLWTRPARYRTKCWDLTTTAVKGSPRKTHPGLPQAAGNHVAMPSPCWGCRDIQDAPDVKKNIQRCEWQWGKINAESNSKDLIN